MAFPTVNDLVKGIDFTALGASATAAQHNQLIEQAVPMTGTNSDGVGFVLATHDTALNTPYVPDAVTHTKWKTYLWVRFPYTAGSTPLIYAWVDSKVVPDGTYQKWILIFDYATLTDSIDALTDQVAGFQTGVDTANANAATAVATANAANTTANTANATANTANTTAANALTATDISQKICRFSETLQGTPAALVAATLVMRTVNNAVYNVGAFVTSDVTGFFTFTVAGTYRIRARASFQFVANGGSPSFTYYAALTNSAKSTTYQQGELGTVSLWPWHVAYNGAGTNDPQIRVWTEVEMIKTFAIGDTLALCSYISSTTNLSTVAAGGALVNTAFIDMVKLN